MTGKHNNNNNATSHAPQPHPINQLLPYMDRIPKIERVTHRSAEFPNHRKDIDET